MNRTAAGFALMLTLLTGLVLGQLSSLGSIRSAEIPASSPLALETAASFYGAVNTTLETGDPVALRTVLHGDFINHSHISESTRTAGELEESLLALRQAFPDLRFLASDSAVQDALVISSMTTTGNTQAVMGGVAMENGPLWTGYEILRIHKDRVIERWASPALPIAPRISTVATIATIGQAPVFRTLRIERLTFERNARHNISSHAGSVIIVESGTFGTQLDPNGSEHGGSQDATLIAPGDSVTVPAAMPFWIANMDGQSGSVLLLTIGVVNSGEQHGATTSPSGPTPGITWELLASGSSIRPNNGPFRLEVHRVQIGPGTGIANHAIVETELMLVTEGTIEIAIRSGDAGFLTEHKTIARQSGSLILTPGQGIAVPADTELSYRATGQSSATLWLVTVKPVN
jgi:quercetin dioxygenase-like cupin family protein